MQKAKAILRKRKLDQNYPPFAEIKEMLLQDNRINYIGQFTKWLIEDREDPKMILEVYELLKKSNVKVDRPVDSFEKMENFFDYLQNADISNEVKHVIDLFPGDLRKHAREDKEILNILQAALDHKSLIEKWMKKVSKYKLVGGRDRLGYGQFKKDLIDQVKIWKNFNPDMVKKSFKGLNVDIMADEPDFLIAKINDYPASQKVGSKSWCITTSKGHWDSYADAFHNQYFIWDFSKSLSDPLHLIGVTIGPNGNVRAAHDNQDAAIRDYEYLRKFD